MKQYFRGLVNEFSDRSGYGYIRPAEGQGLAEREMILVHRHSLRDRTVQLQRGDRVLFTTDVVPRGLLATDCHLDPSSLADSGDFPPEDLPPTQHQADAVVSKNPTNDHSRPSQLRPNTSSGFALQDPLPHDRTSAKPSPLDFLGQAIVARYKRDFERAEKLYAKGLAESPTAQLVLSYAAWEKSRNRKEQAMAIYFKGIERIPANAKLREDAGVLAASVGDYATAVRLLKEALPLSKKARGGGRGVLLALAHTYYDMDDPDSLPSCVHYYEEAQRFKSTGWRLPSADLLQLKLAKIRTQHPRGNIAFKFLRAAGFKIFKAEQLEQATEGADFFVQQTAHPELIESYGLGGQLLLRCSFKSLVSAAD